ncbi:MAG: hypothetical protein PHV42_02655 [Candidatus Pacebacteria bacterium]|nr:hypothetical protein [Candidatus Paceibacterota bacterium]
MKKEEVFQVLRALFEMFGDVGSRETLIQFRHEPGVAMRQIAVTICRVRPLPGFSNLGWIRFVEGVENSGKVFGIEFHITRANALEECADNRHPDLLFSLYYIPPDYYNGPDIGEYRNYAIDLEGTEVSPAGELMMITTVRAECSKLEPDAE